MEENLSTGLFALKTENESTEGDLICGSNDEQQQQQTFASTRENERPFFDLDLVKMELETEAEEQPSDSLLQIKEDVINKNVSFEHVFVKQELFDNNYGDENGIMSSLIEMPECTLDELDVYNTQEDIEFSADPVKTEFDYSEMEINESKYLPSGETDTVKEVKLEVPNDSKLLKVKAPSRTYQRAAPSGKRIPPPWGSEENENLKQMKLKKVEDLVQHCSRVDLSIDYTGESLESPRMKDGSSQVLSKRKRSLEELFDRRFHECMFCKMRFCRIYKHFVKVHSNQQEVSAVKELPRLSTVRLRQFVRLKRLGNFQHNAHSLLVGKRNDLLVLRLSEPFLRSRGSEQFVPCPDCTGFVHESQLFYHYSKCIAKQVRHVPVTRKILLKESRKLLRHVLLSKDTKGLKTTLKVGISVFVSTAKDDPCLTMFGEHMMKIGHQSEDTSGTVRVMMQKMGCLLMACRRYAEVAKLTMSEILLPDRVQLLILAVKTLISSKTEHLQKLELRTDLFSKITTCVFIWRGKCLLEGKLNRADRHLKFYYSFVESWEKELGVEGVKEISGLPLISNLTNLKESLESSVKKLTEEVKFAKQIGSLWYDLAESTICLLCLFNPVDFSAIEQLKVSEYAVRPDWSVDVLEDYRDKLTNIAYHLAAKRFVVSTNFYGKEFVLLFTKEIKKAIDVLISNRYRTCISPNNAFVFASQNYSEGSFKSVNCFYNLCIKTGYLSTDFMRNLKKREYVSFITQISDMSPEEENWAKQFFPLKEKRSVTLCSVSRLLQVSELCQVLDECKKVSKTEEPVLEHKERIKQSFKGLCQEFDQSKWSSEDKGHLLKYFKEEIENEKIPGKRKCTNFLLKNPEMLVNKSWSSIKSFISDEIEWRRKSHTPLFSDFY